jgi:hypothetical protein
MPREWQSCTLFVVVCVLLGVVGILVRPADASRAGSGVLLALSIAVAWFGAKRLDARIARRKRGDAEDSDVLR